MPTIKTIIFCTFFALTGAQCKSAADTDTDRLIIAALKGRPRVVKMLLNNKANANTTDRRGITPLMYAAQKDHDEIVQILLNARAEIDKIDDYGNTALMYAAKNGSDQAVRTLLVNGADTTKQNNYGETALYLARKSRDIQTILTYIEITNSRHTSASKVVPMAENGN